jgi:phenylpyruvate tautomerase PptA (4-oxalocrotonate tautomerase family)
VAATITASARERLAAIEAEKAAIVAEISGKMAAILGEYGAEAVYAVIDEVRNAA